MTLPFLEQRLAVFPRLGAVTKWKLTGKVFRPEACPAATKWGWYRRPQKSRRIPGSSSACWRRTGRLPYVICRPRLGAVRL